MKFLVQLSNAECRGLEKDYKDSRQMSQHSNRMFEQIIQDLFRRVSFSNEDFETVEKALLAWQSSRFELECSWIKMLLQVLDVRREAKRFNAFLV